VVELAGFVLGFEGLAACVGFGFWGVGLGYGVEGGGPGGVLGRVLGRVLGMDALEVAQGGGVGEEGLVVVADGVAFVVEHGGASLRVPG
jgi:hypothetical protein